MGGSLSLLTFLPIWEDLERKNKMIHFPSTSLQLGNTKENFIFLSFLFFSLVTFFSILFFSFVKLGNEA